MANHKYIDPPMYEQGEEYIKTLRKGLFEHIFKPKTYRIGTFGIIGDDNLPHILTWRVDGWRTDRDKMLDTSVELCDTTGRWSNYQFETMFKGWK